MTDDPFDKAVDKSISKLVDGLSTFFGKICMPAATEIGLLLKDKFTYYRIRNLVNIIEKIERLISSDDIANQTSLSPKFLKEIIEESSWEGDDVVQSLWAGLIAGEIKGRFSGDDAIIYTSVLKSMSAYEARILKLVYGDERIADLVQQHEGGHDEFVSIHPIVIPVVDILRISPTPLNYIVQNRSHEDIIANENEHYLAFGFIKPQFQSLIRKGLIDDWSLDDKSIRIEPTSSGLDLYMRCSGIKLYPLNAYIVARKHWRDMKSNTSLKGAADDSGHGDK